MQNTCMESSRKTSMCPAENGDSTSLELQGTLETRSHFFVYPQPWVALGRCSGQYSWEMYRVYKNLRDQDLPRSVAKPGGGGLLISPHALSQVRLPQIRLFSWVQFLGM